MFDMPLPFKVLHPHEGITALPVQHTAIQPLLLRRFKKTVDICSVSTRGTADKHWHSSRVVVGQGSRLGGGKRSALRKKASDITTASDKEKRERH